MSNPNQLFLLADHVKLSLLERQRAHSLNLGDHGAGDAQDGHISRSLDQFRDGLATLNEEKSRLEQEGDVRFVIPLVVFGKLFLDPSGRVSALSK